MMARAPDDPHTSTRVNIKEVLADLPRRRRLLTDSLITLQAREGITTTLEQAEAAYDRVQEAKRR